MCAYRQFGWSINGAPLGHAFLACHPFVAFARPAALLGGSSDTETRSAGRESACLSYRRDPLLLCIARLKWVLHPKKSGVESLAEECSGRQVDTVRVEIAEWAGDIMAVWRAREDVDGVSFERTGSGGYAILATTERVLRDARGVCESIRKRTRSGPRL
jgi:hypothetical protein